MGSRVRGRRRKGSRGGVLASNEAGALDYDHSGWETVQALRKQIEETNKVLNSYKNQVAESVRQIETLEEELARAESGDLKVGEEDAFTEDFYESLFLRPLDDGVAYCMEIYSPDKLKEMNVGMPLRLQAMKRALVMYFVNNDLEVPFEEWEL